MTVRNTIITVIVAVFLFGATAGAESVIFTVGGDALLGGNVEKKTDARFGAYFRDFGAGYFFKNYAGLFLSDDITLLNLECPLKISPTANTRGGRHTAMHGKPEYVNILKSGGIEAVNVANNHMNDYGTKKKTLEILSNNGIVISDEKFRPAKSVVVVRGIRVGFVGFFTPCKLSVIRREVKRAAKSCDIVVASIHSGEVAQYQSEIEPSQIKAAHVAVNCGADIVVGHHPHVVSGIEIYNGKYIFYDTGSIVMSGRDFRANNIVARITLEFDRQSGTVSSEIPTVYPGCASGAGKKADNNCQPILWREGDEEYDEVFDLIDSCSARKDITAGEYLRGAP